MNLSNLKEKKNVYPLAILCASALIFVVFFKYLFPIISPFFIGWLLSLLFCPAVNKLERFHFPRSVSTLLCILLLLSGISFLGYFVGSQLYSQAQTYIQNAPLYLEQLETAFSNIWTALQSYLVALPTFITDFITNEQENFFSFLVSLVPTRSADGSSYLTVIPNFFLYFVITLFSSYFFTKDNEKIRLAHTTHVAPLLGDSYNRTKKDLMLSLVGYLKTQVILMGYVFGICYVGF